MKSTKIVAFAAAALALLAPTARAHGWQPPPPPGPVYNGPEGAGGTNGGEGGEGGGALVDGGQGQGRQAEEAKPEPARPQGPDRGVTLKGNQGAAARATRGAAPAARAKGAAAPWLAEMKVAWRAAFLSCEGPEGYAASPTALKDAMRKPSEEGGVGRGRAAIVLTYDATDAEHLRALRRLDGDDRFLAASRFFDCVRIDVPRTPENADVRLSVFGADGACLGDAAGVRKLSGAYALLRKAFAAEG
ncbi:MAG TPA: hypothetical protein VEI02_06675, partial [Planctomycetota bacterium]|nr:hypothetical protein [Planctomycetota bacterium]